MWVWKLGCYRGLSWSLLLGIYLFLGIIDVVRQHNFFVFQQLRALKNEEDNKPDYSTTFSHSLA